jgi:hypothetical protein
MFLPKRHFKLSATLKDSFHILISGKKENYHHDQIEMIDPIWFESNLPLKGCSFEL